MRLRPVTFLVVPFFTAFVGLAACGNQSEGAPCSVENGNNDCSDGLQCVKPPNSSTNAPEICCPLPGQQPTTSQCSLSGQLDSGNPTAPDGSTFPDSSTGTDGAAESRAPEASTSDSSATSSDAASDAASDAGPG